jgi:phosphoribosylaminoimidazole-succinocarboxamide synthase
MGSVKDLRIIEEPTATRAGIGQFYFSDRYSVFDWGEMPDQLEHKGKALCTIGAYFFERLEEQGVKTHYHGVLHNNSVKKLHEIDEPVDTMQVSLVRVISPDNIQGKYDYSMYSQNEKNLLIPLEIIYRNSLPAGSSIFRRLKNGSLRLEELGLKTMPSPNDRLAEPILDVSTKLEVTDRYLSWKEAQRISALSEEELQTIQTTTKKINNLISEHVENAGLFNEDGKVEYAYDAHRTLILVDIFGTPDECRFTYQGMQVSKQVARDYYKKTPWFGMTEEAKAKDRENWKNLVQDPPRLPARLTELISQLYQSSCNEITGKNWFNVPSLKSILESIQEQMSG